MPTPFVPTSEYVAGTVKTLIEAFCLEYPINNADTRAGVPGTLIGRYPGDHYGGGNPWILLTNYLAMLFYRGASYSASSAKALEPAAAALWAQVLPNFDPRTATPRSLASAFLAAGDGVLQRVRYQ